MSKAQPAEVPQTQPWQPPARLGRTSMLVIGAVVLLFNVPLVHYFLLRQPMSTTATIPYRDDFSDPATRTQHYWSSGGFWRVDNGALFNTFQRNNPLWLRASLPDDVAIDFDVVAREGDIRFEAFGDGSDHGSGYLFFFNNRATIARLDENAKVVGPNLEPNMRARVEGSAQMQPGKRYHMRVERSGTVLRWLIDGAEVVRLNDPTPLKGKWHDRFGFSGWDADTSFDNLVIGPLGAMAAAEPVKVEPAPEGGAFDDAFDRAALGDDWLVTNPEATSIVDGTLVVELEHNRPTWLKRPLPRNATIEFDTWSESPKGDIKVELYGDGRSFYAGDLRMQYTATGYVLIFGGWSNTASVIAKHNEHTPGMPMRRDVTVEPNRHYHWKIVRQGAELQWSVDGQPFLSYTDPQPLEGAGNAYFAFSGWETRVHFDNLSVRPL